MSLVKSNTLQLGQSLTATNNFCWYQPSSPDGTVRLGNGNAGSVTDLITVNSSGNVGIGTTSPSYKLQVVGGNATGFLLDNGGQQYTQLLLQRNGTSNTGGDILIDGTAGTMSIRGLLAGPMIFSTAALAGNTTEKMRLDSSGNLGLGVTPPSGSTNPGLFIGGNQGLFGTSGVQVGFGTNVYNAAGTWKYVATAAATLYQPSSGTHAWYNAPSGTAGNAISFTQAMTLDASGNLLVGGTTTPAGKLSIQVAPNSANAATWGIDFTQCTLTVSSGSNAALPTGSGLIIVNDPNSSGDVGMYLVGGGSATFVSSGGTFVASTTTPAAGKASIAYSGGAYKIYNNIGVTVTFAFALLKTRNNN